ncbi:MAG: proline--tRNA ligase [Chloroflexota bacterium]|nr:proline--tRNA ligase [Chloroflexota bacterium]
MRMTNLFGKTLRQTPSEAENASHQLMLKAGMVHQLASGIYSYLPLAWRSLMKIEGIIRHEMDAIGGQELHMPVLQPLELWQESGRDRLFGAGLFTLSDRRDRRMVLAPTHEEVVTELVRRNVKSYRDLPLMLYQLQTKFRDEPRPRGGLLRVREFAMKDLYSFDVDEAGLDASYQKVVAAYRRICDRCGLTSMVVEADSGAIGGKESHEFTVIAPSGEDVVLHCPHCGYAANAERAESAKAPGHHEEPLPVEEVATPGKKTIEEVAGFLGLPRERTLKAVFYLADGELVFVAIRGDIEVNEVKLKNALKAGELRLATEEEVAAAGLVAGAASPIGIAGIRRIADPSIAMGANLVAGANRPDHHLKNVNYPRDFSVDLVLDIATARAGEGCPRCGHGLQTARGIEVGHVFKLGTSYSELLGATFLDQEGRERPTVMGCYGIGVGRLLAAAIEQNHDEKGIIWPTAIAPYRVYLCPLSMDNSDVTAAAERLYGELGEAGAEVLLDDRDESPGVKLNDADLLGMPLRVVVSPRSLGQGSVEVRWRAQRDAHLVPLEGAAAELGALLFSR